MDTLEKAITNPGDLFTLLCIKAAKEDWNAAKSIAEELANLGAQGIWLELAYDLADGLKKIFQESEKIFSIGERLSTKQIQFITKSRTEVSEQLGLGIPSLVIEIAPSGTPMHAITGISNFGFIIADAASIENQSLLVHEITHCTLMSKSIFLDEGLATLLEHKSKKENIVVDQEYWDRPSLAAMIEIDWRHDPYFSHVLPISKNSTEPIEIDTRVHKLAAYLVKLFVEEKGMPYLVSNWNKLKPRLKKGNTYAVIKELFDIDLWKIDEHFAKSLQKKTLSKNNEDFLNKLITQAFLDGDTAIVKPYISELRIKAFDSKKYLVMLIKALILLGIKEEDNQASQSFRTEALTAMNWAEIRGCKERDLNFFGVYKHVFKLKSAVHAINLRKIGIQASEAFKKLLQTYPNDPEIIVISAMAQLKSYDNILPINIWKEKLNHIIKTETLFANVAKNLLSKQKFSS